MEPLPDDIDSGNEADSKSEEDMPATFSIEPIIAYLHYLDCNNSVENDGKWVINENVAFDYSSCLDDEFNSIHTNSLHVPMPISEMACLQIEDNEGSVFIVPPSRRDQSPIVFGRVQTRTTLSRDSDGDLKSLQFFHYA